MKITPIELIKLTKKAKHQSIKMQNRLLLYWGTMIFLVFAAILVIMSFAGVFSDSEKKMAQVLNLQQKNTYSQISEQFNHLASYGITLSEQTSKLIADVIFNEPVSTLNNSPESLEKIERLVYQELNTTLRSSPCNGAFVMFDATTNTSAPNAINSRAGLYIRFANLSSNKEAHRDLTLFRGIPDIARANEFELHNRWQLEFDLNNIPGYEKAASFSGTRIADGCFWTEKSILSETWENCMMLVVPVLSNTGNYYGICGLEVSELYFRLAHPAIKSDFGSMITILAPIRDDELLVSKGMIGGNDGAYIRDTENYIIKKGDSFNKYLGRDSEFIGIHQETDAKLSDGTSLYAVTLVSSEFYIKEEAENRIAWIIGTVLLFIMTMIVSAVLAKNFVKPIAQSLEAIQDNDMAGAGDSGISEIDSLLSFIKKKGSGKNENNLPSDIEELFNDFAVKAESLTPTERSIIKYYSAGKEINEIPDLCFISINTVRKHNANIYKKLGVGSKEELMLYIELFKRSGRIDKLF